MRPARRLAFEPERCGWCGDEDATTLVYDTPACPSCESSRLARLTAWFTRTRRSRR